MPNTQTTQPVTTELFDKHYKGKTSLATLWNFFRGDRGHVLLKILCAENGGVIRVEGPGGAAAKVAAAKSDVVTAGAAQVLLD